MNGYIVHALVDTGASISCINDQLFEMLRNEQLCDVISDSIYVHGMGGTQTTKGHVRMPFVITNKEFDADFTIIDSIGIDLILGMDFLQAHKANICFPSNTLTLDGGELTVFFTYSRSAVAKITETVTIPPHSESIISLSVTEKDDHNPVLLEPSHTFSHIWQVLPAKCVTYIRNGTVATKIWNPTNSTIKLNSGLVVGHLEHISDVSRSNDIKRAPNTTVYNIAQSRDPMKILQEQLNINLQDADIDDNQKLQLANFLLNQKDIFATTVSELGSCDLQKLVIDTGDNPPVRQRPYRVSPQVKSEIDKQVNEMLENQIIRESYSSYSSPVVMVKKKNGEYRFAIDYRKLNSITKTMNYPLPTFQDVTDLLGKAKLFSVMDMKSGFWQLQIDEESKEKTAFICHSGLYEFNRVPFGLKNSPIIFQQVVEQALRGMNYYTALVYVDDIISFSPCFETHLHNLQQIFQRL